MDLAAKLQLKPGQKVEAVLLPESVSSELVGCPFGNDESDSAALMVFVADRAALEAHRAHIVQAASIDRLTWVAYPKAGQLGTDLNRDSLAALLSEGGIRPVRQVALNGVWSSLRFRPA
jgi:hypothetical protein